MYIQYIVRYSIGYIIGTQLTNINIYSEMFHLLLWKFVNLQSKEKYHTVLNKPTQCGFVMTMNGSHTCESMPFNSLLCVLLQHRLVPLIGLTESSSAHSCKKIKEQLSSSCTVPARSGAYWVQGMKVYIL